MELATEVGFFQQTQMVTIPSVIKVKVKDLVNLVFGSGLETLSWWGTISFADANGKIGFDEIDNGKFDAQSLDFLVEFWNEDGEGDSFSTKVITLSDLVNAIGQRQEFVNAIAEEDVDVFMADSILQRAIYGKEVWG